MMRSHGTCMSSGSVGVYFESSILGIWNWKCGPLNSGRLFFVLKIMLKHLGRAEDRGKGLEWKFWYSLNNICIRECCFLWSFFFSFYRWVVSLVLLFLMQWKVSVLLEWRERSDNHCGSLRSISLYSPHITCPHCIVQMLFKSNQSGRESPLNKLSFSPLVLVCSLFLSSFMCN